MVTWSSLDGLRIYQDDVERGHNATGEEGETLEAAYTYTYFGHMTSSDDIAHVAVDDIRIWLSHLFPGEIPDEYVPPLPGKSCNIILLYVCMFRKFSRSHRVKMLSKIMETQKV